MSSKQGTWPHTTSPLLWESKLQLQTALEWEELYLVGGQQERRKAAVLHWVEKKAMRTNGRTQITISHLRNIWFPPKTCHYTNEKISQARLECKWLSLARALPLVPYVLTITPPVERYSAKQAMLVNCFITRHRCWSLSSPLSELCQNCHLQEVNSHKTVKPAKGANKHQEAAEQPRPFNVPLATVTRSCFFIRARSLPFVNPLCFLLRLPQFATLSPLHTPLPG